VSGASAQHASFFYGYIPWRRNAVQRPQIGGFRREQGRFSNPLDYRHRIAGLVARSRCQRGLSLDRRACARQKRGVPECLGAKPWATTARRMVG
jgi:hypothetical protein